MAHANINLLSKIVLTFVFGLGLVVFVYILDYGTSEDLIDSFRRVEQMQDIQLRMVDIESLMKDVQRSHRGYVITGNEEFLGPYKLAAEKLPPLLLLLSQHLADNPRQSQDFRVMQQLIAAKLAYADSAIAGISAGERQTIGHIERGKSIFDRLSLVQRRMINREKAHLASVRQEAEANTMKNRRVILIAFMVSATLLLLALWRITLYLANIKKLQLELEAANNDLASYNEELLTMNQILSESEHKLHAVNQQLESSNLDLQKLSTDIGTFSYSISHDLRAPLRAISGYSSILKEEFGEKLGSEGMRLIEIIRLNANRLGALIQDLLNFSKLGKKAVNKHACDMHILAKQVLAESIVKEGAIIKIATMEPAMADPVLIRQVWENLISNALKFSARKEVPEISITYCREKTRQIFCVKDNGIGFDTAYALDLFQVFKRLHADNDFEGTGAGLAIARRIVEAHGGEIWADAQPDRGATFCFSLPVAE